MKERILSKLLEKKLAHFANDSEIKLAFANCAGSFICYRCFKNNENWIRNGLKELSVDRQEPIWTIPNHEEKLIILTKKED